jgi:hypothetical protein
MFELKAGIFDLSSDAYHADPSETPSLSSSIASVLCNASPAHARARHPKLNPDYERETSDSFDVGTVVHQILLEGDEGKVAVGEWDEWRSTDAKLFRDEARRNGLTPLKPREWETVQRMVEAVVPQLERFELDPPLFASGHAEQTVIWHDDGVACRALVDWLHTNYAAIDDIKTCRDANPDRWSRRSMLAYGYDVQAVFHARGVEAVTGVRPVFRWVVMEKQPPYVVSVVTPGSDVLTVAEAKVDYALRTWRRCIESGEWPSYPSPFVAELPAWAEDARWLVIDDEEVAA